MQIRADQLKFTLTDNPLPIYFIFGHETLLIEQSTEQIKKVAKKNSFSDKISFEIDNEFNFEQLKLEISSASLFHPQRIIECRFKADALNIKTSKELIKIISPLANGILLIISAGKLTPTQQKSKWFQTLSQKCKVVQHKEVKNNMLPNWVLTNMIKLGLEKNVSIANNIATYTEGSLLAAMQEIQKLKIAYPNGKIDATVYKAQIKEQSKYTVYGLIDAALSGNTNQVNKIYNTLINDKAIPIILNNALYLQIKNIVGMALDLQKNKPLATIFQKYNVWSFKKPAITKILKLYSYQQLQKILLSLGRVERSIKGADNLNVIDELQLILLTLNKNIKWTR